MNRGLPALGAVACLLQPACAPLAVMRPASGLAPGRSLEAGLAAVSLGPRPYVDEPSQLTAQAWVTGEPRRWLTLSAVAGFDTSALAVGGAARWNVLRTPRVAGGLEGEAGYAWVAGSVPLAASPIDGLWLYSAPRVGTLGYSWTLGVPVGLSIELWPELILRGEAQLSWGELMYYNQRLHLAVGIAHQF